MPLDGVSPSNLPFNENITTIESVIQTETDIKIKIENEKNQVKDTKETENDIKEEEKQQKNKQNNLNKKRKNKQNKYEDEKKAKKKLKAKYNKDKNKIELIHIKTGEIVEELSPELFKKLTEKANSKEFGNLVDKEI